MTDHRTGKLVYHTTALSNLPSIARRGLLSRAALTGSEFCDVASQEILRKREENNLQNFVPFHFRPKTPFDYGLSHAHPTTAFIILAVYRSFAEANAWSIVPRHPLAGGAEMPILSWRAGLDEIDWDKVNTGDWEDHDSHLACMAEALSPSPVELSMLQSIFVPSAETESAVRASVGQRVRYVNVKPRMFPPKMR